MGLGTESSKTPRGKQAGSKRKVEKSKLAPRKKETKTTESKAKESARDLARKISEKLDSKPFSFVTPTPIPSAPAPTFTKTGIETTKQGDEMDFDFAFEEGPRGTAFDGDVSVSDMGNQDVFDYAYQLCQQYADLPRFLIYKNGELVSTKNWPYSWEKVQAEFGAGHYKVQAKRMSNNTIIKTQTQLVGEDPTKTHAAIQAEAAPQARVEDQWTKMWAMMKQEQKEAEERAREAARLQIEQNTTLMNTLLQVTGQKQQNQSSENSSIMQVLLQMQQMNMEAQRVQQERTDKMFEKLADAIGKSQEKKGPDAFEMLKMMRDSEERAIGFYERMQEMVEAKLELQGGGSEGEDGETKKESVNDVLIKSFAPALAQMFVGRGASPVPQIPQAIPQAPQAAQTPQLRREVFQGQVNDPNLARAQAQARAQKAGAGTPAQTANRSDTRGAAIRTQQQQQDLSVKVAPKAEGGQIRDKILEIALPNIGQSLLDAMPASESALKVLSLLEAQSITRDQVAQNFTLDDMLQIGAQYNLPQEANEWLKEFHAHIAITPKVRTRGSAPSQELST